MKECEIAKETLRPDYVPSVYMNVGFPDHEKKNVLYPVSVPSASREQSW